MSAAAGHARRSEVDVGSLIDRPTDCAKPIKAVDATADPVHPGVCSSDRHSNLFSCLPQSEALQQLQTMKASVATHHLPSGACVQVVIKGLVTLHRAVKTNRPARCTRRSCTATVHRSCDTVLVTTSDKSNEHERHRVSPSRVAGAVDCGSRRAAACQGTPQSRSGRRETTGDDGVRTAAQPRPDRTNISAARAH